MSEMMSGDMERMQAAQAHNRANAGARVESMATIALAPAPGTGTGKQAFSGRNSPLRLFQGHYHRLAALALAEAMVAAIAFYAAVALRFQEIALDRLGVFLGPIWPRALLVASLVVMALASMGLYSLRHRVSMSGVVARVVVAGIAAAVGLAVAFYAVPDLYLGRGALFLTFGFAVVGLVGVRVAFLRLVDQDRFKRRVIVWGCGERAASIETKLRRRSDQRGFRIMGYVNAAGEKPQVPANIVLQDTSDLMRRILSERIEEVVIAMDDRRTGFPYALLRQCRLAGISVRDIVTFLEEESGRVSVDLAQPSWLIFSEGFQAGLVGQAAKRAFDITIALLLLVFSAPIALATALAIYIEDRGPVLYRQIRVGQDGRPFKMLKFRSMSVDAESKGAAVWAVKNDPRVTRVGEFIRKVRIDELPQAINVLMGDMSFVGPRPERPAFVDSLSQTIPFYVERHFVKPGITGWAQVSFPYGSSEADAREKLGYDLYYVKNRSLMFDLMVMLRTVEIVLFRVGSR